MPSEIIGRDAELATLGAFVDTLEEGSAMLVLHGEAGMGKTTLWQACLDSAHDRSLCVLSGSPTEAEATMSFAALDDLLGPVIETVLPELPAPQRRALEVALLLAEAETGRAVDARAVSVAFLNALRQLAASRPLLLAVDDVQWLDTASASALAYAARRLHGLRAGLLLSERTGETTSNELEQALTSGGASSLTVPPLTTVALHRLVRERLGIVLTRPLVQQLHETSAGNPFYALEIARALELERSEPSAGKPLPLLPTLGGLLHGRIEELPADTRDLLAVAAAMSEPRVSLLSAALDVDVLHALGPALDAHVVVLEGERVRFVHPLLVDAAYSAVDVSVRRGVHSRLAAVVDDAEEQARHLALSSDGPDNVVAGALERAAARARARGASATAAQLCEHARALTPSDRAVDVHRRTMTGAWHWFAAGDTARARTLLEEAFAAAEPGALRAEAMTALGRLAITEGDQPAAADLLRRALAEAVADDAVRAEASQGLATALFFMREELGTAHEYEQAAVDLAQRLGNVPLYLNALATRGLIEALLGRPEAAETIEATFSVRGDPDDRVLAWPSQHRAYFELWVDRPDLAAPTLSSLVDEATARGDESSLPAILSSLSLALFLQGRWSDALRHAEDAYELSLQVGQRHLQAWSLSTRALVRAASGAAELARADATEALAIAGDRAMGVARTYAVWALGLLELSLDRPEEAVRCLAPVREQLVAAGVAEPGAMRFVPDEIEALVSLRRTEEAEALLVWLEERGHELDRASALGAAARCRGLLAAAAGDLEGALAAFERALVEQARVPNPFERARTLLALGATQRRAKKKSAPRASLERAEADFTELGAPIWAEKARSELARISGRAPSRDDLTLTERRVAVLVAEGKTNKEVAAALFVSHRTVEFHLSHVYRKLGVRSRAELARSLEETRTSTSATSSGH